jgi:F-type H+-transporting ATPase subunit b
MNFIDIALASPEAVVEYVTESSADAGLLASLGLNGSQFVFQWINFAIVVAVLWFLILKPLVKTLNNRQKMIDDSIANSEKIQKNLEKSEKDYQHKIDQAKVEANKIMEKANAEAGVVGEELKVKAKKEIEQLVDHAKKNIRLEKEEMVAGLKEQTVEIVVAAVEKILNEKMDGKKDKELIEAALKDVK